MGDAMDYEYHWYCYITEIGCDERAAWNLKAAGYTVFAPQMTRTIHHARRVHDVDRPLFPRHGFVGSTHDGLGKALRTRGVAGLLRMGQRYCSVPGGVVDELMARQKAGAFDFRDRPPPDPISPPIGSIVRITGAGPFRGFAVKVEHEMDDDRRVGILLRMFNSVREVRMPVDQLAEICQ